MIMIWNRKEVYVGTDMGRFGQIRDILTQNNINYDFKIVNRNNTSVFGSNRSRVGTFGEKANLAYEYYIYVHKNDYDEASTVIYKYK